VQTNEVVSLASTMLPWLPLASAIVVVLPRLLDRLPRLIRALNARRLTKALVRQADWTKQATVDAAVTLISEEQRLAAADAAPPGHSAERHRPIRPPAGARTPRAAAERQVHPAQQPAAEPGDAEKHDELPMASTHAGVAQHAAVHGSGR
jgi:hypothetical protein